MLALRSTGPFRPPGRQRFAVTGKFGRLWKITFSILSLSRSTMPVTRAFSGGFSGQGPKQR